MNTNDQLLTKHSTKALWSECSNHLWEAASVQFWHFSLCCWFGCEQHKWVKGLVSCQDHRSWSSGGYDLLQAMFLITRNLIPLNHNPSEHAVATVEAHLQFVTLATHVSPSSPVDVHYIFVVLGLNIGISLPYLRWFCARWRKLKQQQQLFALGIPAGTAFLSQSEKESQDCKGYSSPIAGKIIYTFDGLPAETN